MQTIKVVGAGFSGLVTAYFLTKQRFKVQVYEQSSRAGGLIKTIRTPHGLIETAANGLLNSARLEAMCADIEVPLLATRRDGRKRFIFRGRPKQIPLVLSEMLNVGLRSFRNLNRLRPRQFETIGEWGSRVVGRGATDYLLTPALGGIYAGDPQRMSASLIFGRAVLPDHLHTNRPQRAKIHGTVAPPNGMQQLIDGLYDYLNRAGVEFLFNQPAAKEDCPTVVCLSASSASDYLAGFAPEVSQALATVEMLSIVTVTSFYAPEAGRLKGFGCLFPQDQGFRARGVLFNDCIFDGRGPAHSETWIFGGALDPEVMNLNDEKFAELIAGERERLYGANDELVNLHITRWPNALPHYTIDLERILITLPPPPPNIALVGNYLGRIGLAKLLERAALVADDFGKTHEATDQSLGRAHN
ncbi:MAG TPA: FAD-dependent oxidoreductase [Pyrinomonadaceae bacterium]|nr:FAD-dependent oxidoreductase [Pyrinomonadaceae bacterium]